ncbi:Large extracellular alpha-helical protein [Chitinispirillum alkaliphilum]|nr:Large extracellular alpha-helical protein [Chitinispirillum alkaliphilum]
MPFSMDSTVKEISIPIKDAYTPNIHVEVHLSGMVDRCLPETVTIDSVPKAPALANGTINLPVPPTHRSLQVSVEPKQKYLQPGDSTEVRVVVKDWQGNAVPDAEVTLIVVDEAVLALSNYELRNPVDLFYNEKPALVSSFHNRTFIRLAFIENIFDLRGFGSGFGLQTRSALSVSAPDFRSDFSPLAAFIPNGRTNSSGEFTPIIKLPDNVTRYRIMVVAADGPKRFGTAENSLTARLPLTMRPSPPRFLNFGDHFELPVVLQNQTDDTLTVDVVIRGQNADLKKQGYRVSIPAEDRAAVHFPAATVAAGTARFQVVATTADGFSDAVSFELPVWTPATTESFATYGTIDTNAVFYLIRRPDEIWPQFGGVQVSKSSTALQALTDAFVYLYNYPFASSELLASRIIATTALDDVLHAFNVPDIPTPEQIKRRIQSDIWDLTRRQNRNNGGFAFWPGQSANLFTSLHAIHALTRAHNEGYEVSERSIELTNSYLSNIRRNIPGYYSQSARRTILAFSLYVRALGGDFDENKARTLLKDTPLEQWSIESLGWLLYALSGSPESDEVKEIIRHLNNHVHETASTAQFNRSFFSGDDHHLVFHSSRRADAIVLEALMEVQPESDLIVKLVRGLLAHRRAGRWRNTSENCFVLLALDSYFRNYESQTPDFVARAWLGSQYAGDHSFEGRTTETHQITVPMHFLADTDTAQNLILQKDGTGRLYYRVGMNYAPRSFTIAPADHGFSVERHYEGVDNEDDVEQMEDGTWVIRAGARVKVTVQMVAQGRRYHVALVDPIPAGLEPLNPALAVTGTLPRDSSNRIGSWWSGRWFEHQNLRDERAEAFSTLLYGGVYNYVYYALATTPGEFVVPPAKAEEMYAPETFGRSGSDRVVVR